MASRVIAKNIMSRTRELHRVGLLKATPLWLDVAESFPPLQPPWPDNKGKAEGGKPTVLAFPKDKWRRVFYRKYDVPKEILTLYERSDSKESTATTCDRYVLKVEELLKSGLSDRDASQQAALYLRRQGVKLQIKKDIPVNLKSKKQAEKGYRSISDLLDILS